MTPRAGSDMTRHDDTGHPCIVRAVTLEATTSRCLTTASSPSLQHDEPHELSLSSLSSIG